MVTGCIIQARVGSTRLPGKVLMNIDDNNPLLYYVVKQLQYAKRIDTIIIATTTLEEDNKIVEFSHKIGINCFRGSPKDVLDRYYQCAKEFSLSTIVRVTADNPFIDPTIVDQVIEKFNSNSYDYVTNHIPRTFPQGTETEVFSFKALKLAWNGAQKSSEREHVTPYFYNNPHKFRIFVVRHSKDLSYLRWTVDNQDDYKLAQTIALKIKKRPILMTDIIKLLSQEPHLVDINKEYVLDEGYKKSLKEDQNLN